MYVLENHVCDDRPTYRELFREISLLLTITLSGLVCLGFIHFTFGLHWFCHPYQHTLYSLYSARLPESNVFFGCCYDLGGNYLARIDPLIPAFIILILSTIIISKINSWRRRSNVGTGRDVSVALKREDALSPQGVRTGVYSLHLCHIDRVGNITDLTSATANYEGISSRFETLRAIVPGWEVSEIDTLPLHLFLLDETLFDDLVVPKVFEPSIAPVLRQTRIKQAANSVVFSPAERQRVLNTLPRLTSMYEPINPYEFTQVVLGCHLEYLAKRSRNLENFLVAQ